MNQPSSNPVALGFPSTSPAGKSILAGREVSPDFPRDWFEFVDPDDPTHYFSIDLTWVESTWSCRFGTSTCRGIDESFPVVGCCIHGAYLSDESDRDVVYDAVAEMDPRFWQLRPADVDSYLASADPTVLEPWLEFDDTDPAEDPEGPHLKTKLVDGACIFANRADAETGPGCSLHQWAVAQGSALIGSKPEVCWQVPFSREDAWEERSDGVDILRTTIGEYHRRQWGGGGEDFDWWCTAAPSCHTAPAATESDATETSPGIPVFKSMRSELIALIGEKPYEILAAHCEARAKAPAAVRAVHPATAQASNL